MHTNPTPTLAIPQAAPGKRHLTLAILASAGDERAEAHSATVASIAPRLEERSRHEPSFEALGLTA
jgi:hypothetical protein